MEQKTVIPVFFTIDENYAPYLAVAAHSLIENALHDYQYKIIVLHEDVSAETQAHIRLLERPWAQIEFVAMQQCFKTIHDHISNRLRADYFTMTIYFRLLIPDMFPQYDKGIYIDSDVVVPSDISEMYGIDLGDNLLGVCRDYSIHHIPELVHYITDAIGAGKERYFNSGVLLMNLKHLRELRLATRFIEVLNRWHFDCIAPDQDYLNALCMGHVVYMDRRWDTMPNRSEQEIENPLLIHYNLFEKPWLYDGIQYADYFWKYAADSGYMEWLQEYKRNYSDEQKRADRESLMRLVQRAEQIASMPDNFHAVFSSGREKRLL